MAQSENSAGARKQGSMSVREAGRKGGEVTAQRHGPQFYQDFQDFLIPS